MRAASRSEAFVCAGRLQSWRSLPELQIFLEQMRAEFGYFVGSQTLLQPWREAFRALQFAKKVGATAVRLGDDPPDAYLRFPEEDLPVELTDIKNPSFTTSWEFNEYARLAQLGCPIPAKHFDPSEEIRGLPDRLARAVTRKLSKGYPKTYTLAIHAELFWFESEAEWLKREIAYSLAPAAKQFREIWVLICDRLFRFS